MFPNRRSAGRQLAARLEQLREEKPVVLALPRGGVPVGFEIAEGLDARSTSCWSARSGCRGSPNSRSVRWWTEPIHR
jgi:hypothetical protein